MAFYRCVSCNYTTQEWDKCPKCGAIFCERCARQGKGGYPKMKALNNCIYCNRTISLIRLNASDPELEMMVKNKLAKK